MKLNKALPCRKCGESDYNISAGKGTDAEMYCNSCGASECYQISDITDELGMPRPKMYDDYTYPDEVVKVVKNYIINEWNKRAIRPNEKQIQCLSRDIVWTIGHSNLPEKELTDAVSKILKRGLKNAV